MKPSTTANTLIVRELGQQEYHSCWQAMQNFTAEREEESRDELWLLEHPPVYTQGQNGKAEHILNNPGIPVIPIDRGGQVTYHGPGQLVAYTLVDIKRKGWSIRQFVSRLEQSVIELLGTYGIPAEAQCKAPGVYVQEKKICSLGLRIRRGSVFHGLALNVDMDLKPFSYINPCGFAGLKMTQLSDFLKPSMAEVKQRLVTALAKHLAYSEVL